MPNDLAAQIDPMKLSRDLLLVICFQNSTSKNLPMAMMLAKQASYFQTGTLGDTTVNAAGFKMNSSDASIASALLRYVCDWRGTLLFANGRLTPFSHEIQRVLDCYMDAEMCRDSRAHCEKIIDDPEFRAGNTPFGFSINIGPQIYKTKQVKRFAFPCSLLFPSFRFQAEHEASYASQIHAAGISMRCNICPKFNPDSFREVGIATYQIAVD